LPSSAPSSPTALSATSPKSARARLTWRTPAFDGGASAVYYRVVLKNGKRTVTRNTSSRKVDLSGLLRGRTYTVRVYACSSAGCSSPARTTVRVK
jgi:hypothetical protein